MAERDLTLSVGLNTGDAREDAKALAKEVDDILKKDSGTTNSKILNMDKDMVKATSDADILSAELDKIANKQIPTDAYRQQNAELEKANAHWESLLTKEERYVELGKTPPKALTHDIEVAAERATRLEAELQDIVITGKAFTLGKDTEEFKKKEAQLNNVNNRLKVQIAKHREATDAISEQTKKHQENTNELNKQVKAATLLKSAMSNLGNTVKTIGSGLNSAGAKITAFATSIKHSISNLMTHRNVVNSNTLSVNKLIKAFLKWGLGIRSTFILVRRLRAAISEGVTNLVKWNSGLNSTNDAVSRLQSSVQYLKNSLGALASPIIQLVTPALETLIDRLARVANMIAQIIGALTGKKTVTVAKKTTVNAAGTDTSGSKKEDAYKKAQEKYEAAKKKAEERYQKQLKAVEEKRAKAAAKAEERQAKAAQKLAKAQEEVNDALGTYDKLNIINTKDTDNLIDDMEDLQDLYEDPVLEEINPEDFFGDLADAGGSALADMFEEVPIDSIAQDWANKIKEKISELMAPIQKAWDNTKDYVIGSWTKAIDAVKNLMGSIWRDFIKVWNESGTIKIFEDIFKTVGNIGNTVKNLANRFREAWDNNDNGLKILRNIRDIIGIITDKIEFLSSKTAEWAGKLDFNPLLENTGKLLESMKEPVQFLADVLGDFYTIVILPLTKWLIEEGIPKLEQVFIDFSNKVDWESLRESLQELWEHLEPFAEKVGEGLILFIEDVSDALADFLNSQEFKDFLKSVEDWMDKVTPEDVAKGLKAIAIAILAFKFTNFVGPGFVGFITFIKLLAKPIGALGSLATKLMGLGTAAETAATGTSVATEEVASLGTAAGMSAAGMVAGTAAAVGLSYGINKASEAAHGGNGYMTEYGGALHSLTQELTDNGKLTDEQSEKLYHQIEAWESVGYSSSSMSTLYVNALSDMNVSTEDATTAVTNLAGQNSITMDTYKSLQTEVGKLQSSTKLSTDENTKNITSYEELYKAVQQTANDMRLTDNQVGILNTSMNSANAASGDLTDVYNALIESTELAGVDTKEFATKLGVTVPTDAKKATSALDTTSKKEIKLGDDAKKAGDKVKTGMNTGTNAIDKTSSSADKLGNKVESGMNRASNSTGKFEDKVDKSTDNIRKDFEDTANDSNSWGRDLVQNFIDGINERLGKLRDKVREMAELIEEHIGFSEPEKGPLSDFHTYAPDMIDLFIKGLKENEPRLAEQMSKSLDISDKIMDSIQSMDVSKLTLPDITVGKVIPTSMAMNNAGGGNEAGNRDNNDIKKLLRQLLEVMEESETNLPPVELTLDKKVVARAVFDEQEKRYKQLGQYVPSFT